MRDHDLPKYSTLKNEPDIPRMDDSKSNARLLRQMSVMSSMTAIFVVAMLMGFYIGHMKVEMNRMTVMIEENQNQIKELQFQLERLKMDLMSNIKYEEPVENHRSKRQSPSDDFIGAHLVGVPGRNSRHSSEQIPQMDNFFHFSYNYDNAFSLMAVQNNDDEAGTFIVVSKEGFYYVYAQMTYIGHGVHEVGHEIVRIRNIEGEVTREILVSSINTQQLSSNRQGNANRSKAKDSYYHSGVFYLYPEDKIGVKPLHYASVNSYLTESTKTFFGAYFIHE